MNEKVLGKANCSRISHDNTRATNPIESAVIAFASWQKTYFVTQLFGW
jgi:hypothetical protein